MPRRARSGLRPHLTLAICGLALLLLTCGDGREATSPAEAVVVFVAAAGQPVELQVEVADTPEERTRGLMFRQELPQDRGMLFDFGGETGAGFWMKDTYIPLSIAFISSGGVIVDIQDMEPLSTETRRSREPFAFAVEVNRGWFERHGIVVGSRVLLPGSTP